MSGQCKDRDPFEGKPSWLRRPLPKGSAFGQVAQALRKHHVHTVCEEARCPNRAECFCRHTATFLLLGSRCTRNCRFCAVEHGPLEPPDPKEPEQVAETAAELGLRYVVLTSVTRDDVPDQGTGIFAQSITSIRQKIPGAMVEVLVPDFQGRKSCVQTVLKAEPNVFNHNVETVPRIAQKARPQADYQRSLRVLTMASSMAPHIPTKSGLMLGLGESDLEIQRTLEDMLQSGCRILTLGQYLQPTPAHLPVHRYIPPKDFDAWREIALSKGFDQVASGPLVRSSYQAHALYQATLTASTGHKE